MKCFILLVNTNVGIHFIFNLMMISTSPTDYRKTEMAPNSFDNIEDIM